MAWYDKRRNSGTSRCRTPRRRPAPGGRRRLHDRLGAGPHGGRRPGSTRGSAAGRTARRWPARLTIGRSRPGSRSRRRSPPTSSATAALLHAVALLRDRRSRRTHRQTGAVDLLALRGSDHHLGSLSAAAPTTAVDRVRVVRAEPGHRTDRSERSRSAQEVVVYELLSLDGVASRPTRSSSTGTRSMDANLAESSPVSGSVILGRRSAATEWADYWPTATSNRSRRSSTPCTGSSPRRRRSTATGPAATRIERPRRPPYAR